ncbi:MAG: Asp23/Gls24 family envelope stress response protein [Bacilli bacterium]
MSNYLNISSSAHGKIAISAFVFQEIATECLENLAKGELKDSLCLKNGKREGKVSVNIDSDGKTIIQTEILGYKGADMASCSKAIQTDIYEAVYNMLEISQVKVNVSVIGIVSQD